MTIMMYPVPKKESYIPSVYAGVANLLIAILAAPKNGCNKLLQLPSAVRYLSLSAQLMSGFKISLQVCSAMFVRSSLISLCCLWIFLFLNLLIVWFIEWIIAKLSLDMSAIASENSVDWTHGFLNLWASVASLCLSKDCRSFSRLVVIASFCSGEKLVDSSIRVGTMARGGDSENKDGMGLKLN